MTKKESGVYEWTDKSVSIFKGCENNCSYCYSYNIARRYGWCPEAGWDKPVFNDRVFKQKIRKTYPRGIFCFTSHDIYPSNVEICWRYILNNILKTSGNRVLLVSKAHPEAIEYIEKQLLKYWKYKHRIEFRFTITTCDDKLREYWEPGAPSITDRITTLKKMHKLGYKMSASMEPFLDEDPIPLIKEVAPYVDSCWLGAMTGKKYDYHSKENLEKIVADIEKLPKNLREKIHLKNSFRDKLFK